MSRNVRSRFARAVVLSCVLGPAAASAGTFDLKTPEVEKGEREAEHNTSVFSGFPTNADRLRASTETSMAYGVTDWWKLSGKFNGDKPIGDDWQISTAGVESIFLLRKQEAGFALAWFSGLDVRVHRDETNAVSFGPVFRFGTDTASVTLNTFLSRTFGPNHTEGIDFVYGWQAKRELREGLALGIEGYGVIPEIGDAPGADSQEHRIGPVVYLEHELGNGNGKSNGKAHKGGLKDGSAPDKEDGPKLAIEAGVLFGLTNATQDVAFKLKAGISW